MRQSAKSAVESFQEYTACSTDGFVLKGQIGRIQERRESRDYLCLRQFVSASQYPFCFQQDKHTYQDRFALLTSRSINRRAFSYCDWSSRIKYRTRNVGIYTEHQRESSSMGTGFLPFLYRSPASSDTRLFLTRITTTPSGINVKLILSPVFIPRLSRIAFGIVVCPLLVSVASVLMVDSILLTEQIIVRIRRMGKRADKFLFDYLLIEPH